jgi:soluble lytic murein transglycosylase-like protein
MRFVGRVLSESGADPLVRGRRHRRPRLHPDGRTRGSGADGGVRPTFTAHYIRCLAVGVVFSIGAMAQSAPNAQEASRAAMAASVDKQRASILIQVNSVLGKPATPVGSFFSAPWVEAAFAEPACDTIASPELDRLIEQNSKTQGVKPELIRAVISQESANRPCALSPKGAQGLMQLMPATSAQFGVSDPFDAQQNVEAGTKLLKQLLEKYAGDVSLTLSAYNAGSGRVDRDGGVPQIPETMKYVTDILGKLPKP